MTEELADPEDRRGGQRILPILPGDEPDWEATGFTAFIGKLGESGEQAHSCQEAINLAPGRYRLWVASEQWVSPFAIHFGATDDGSVGEVGVNVVPAGEVKLPAALADSGAELQLRHVEQADYAAVPGVLQFEMSRTAPAASGGRGLKMPRGQTLALLRQKGGRPGTGEVVALSRPFLVRGGFATTVEFEMPGSEQSFLLAEFNRSAVPTAPDRRMDVWVKTNGHATRPDFVVQMGFQVVAIWYGLAPGKVELSAELDHEFAAAVELELPPGVITTTEQRLLLRPKLEVQLSLPDFLEAEENQVRILETTKRTLVAEQATRKAQTLEFRQLPAKRLEVELMTSLGSVSERVDLSDARDASILLEVDPIEVLGKVYLGEVELAAAELEFITQGGHKIATQSDETGSYRILSLAPLRQVTIRPAGELGSPYAQIFFEAIQLSTTRDFHLPDAEIVVRVVERTSGQTVPGASVAMRNIFPATDAEGQKIPSAPGEPQPTDAIAQALTANERGEAALRFLRAGEVEIRVSAAGYQAIEAPSRAVHEGDRQQLTIELEKFGAQRSLRLLLGNGQVAAQAEAELLDSLVGNTTLWVGQADDLGELKVPHSFVGALLVRHPAGAVWVGSYPPSSDTVELVPAAPALLVRWVDAERNPLPHARVRLAVAGQPWSEAALVFFGMSFAADHEGNWRSSLLPRAPLTLLGFAIRQQEAAESGQLQSYAVEIPFPWPEHLELVGIP